MTDVASDLVPHVAFADCEEIRPGLIGQPANTLSSLAFVAAAIPIARAARTPGRGAWHAVAWAAALEGVGSVAYHGPGGAWSKRLHDAGILALGATLTVAHLREPWRVPPARSLALAATAVVVHALSRTGGPLCSCRSPLQGHSVFHALAAAALAQLPGETPDGPVPRTGRHRG
jgi:hypothetical protein